MKVYIKAKRNHAVKVAKELFYSETVIELLKKAQNEWELSRILCNARKGNY